MKYRGRHHHFGKKRKDNFRTLELKGKGRIEEIFDFAKGYTTGCELRVRGDFWVKTHGFNPFPGCDLEERIKVGERDETVVSDSEDADETKPMPNPEREEEHEVDNEEDEEEEDEEAVKNGFPLKHPVTTTLSDVKYKFPILITIYPEDTGRRTNVIDPEELASYFQDRIESYISELDNVEEDFPTFLKEWRSIDFPAPRLQEEGGLEDEEGNIREDRVAFLPGDKSPERIRRSTSELFWRNSLESAVKGASNELTNK